MTWISEHLDQITAVLVVVILLTLGRSKLIPGAKGHMGLMWVAFIVTAICGLILGWALTGVVSWITSSGTLGTLLALPAMVMGWHAVYLLVALVRDLADKRPDDDARKAALWVPTFLPAGGQAVWSVVTHPHGALTGFVTVAIAAITIGYATIIVKAALKGKTVKAGWSWFAAGVCLLAGVVAIPLVLYLDGLASTVLPPGWLLFSRIILGTVGLALLVAAVKDIADMIPDAAVRVFLQFGLPLLFAFGTLAITYMTGSASNGGQILSGSLR